MAARELSLKANIAWWVRPALVPIAVLARICPACAGRCIDFIVDKGIKVEAA